MGILYKFFMRITLNVKLPFYYFIRITLNSLNDKCNEKYTKWYRRKCCSQQTLSLKLSFPLSESTIPKRIPKYLVLQNN